MVGSWHHYYNQNWQSGVNVLAQAKAFMDVPPPQGTDEFGNLQLPLLNPVRDATLAYGDYRDHGFLADMGLYQGARVGPYVEQTYIQLLEQRYLPSLMNGLIRDLNIAPPESEENARCAARSAHDGRQKWAQQRGGKTVHGAALEQ